jgi:hypothetical protein
MTILRIRTFWTIKSSSLVLQILTQHHSNILTFQYPFQTRYNHISFASAMLFKYAAILLSAAIAVSGTAIEKRQCEFRACTGTCLDVDSLSRFPTQPNLQILDRNLFRRRPELELSCKYSPRPKTCDTSYGASALMN